MRVALLWLLGPGLQLLAACSQAPSAPSAPTIYGAGGRTALPPSTTQDSDRDGLCDLTEERLGTQLTVADTDGDGLPDATELIAGFDPQDPATPGADQVGYLMASAGAVLDFELRSTVEGQGGGATGEFTAHSAFDAASHRASDYFISAVAVGAEPPDNVRGIQATSERFSYVLGRTRLSFRLRFEYGAHDARPCAAALPFSYAVKIDRGGVPNGRESLLIVTPKPTPTADDFCSPVTCL